MATTCAVLTATGSMPVNTRAVVLGVIYDTTRSTTEAAAHLTTVYGLALSRNQVHHHRSGGCQSCKASGIAQPQTDRPKPSAAEASKTKARLTTGEDGTVTVKDVPLYTPLQLDDDLSPLLIQFGLNPDTYEVLRDTFSMWMQSASDGDGGRDVVYLYSARFRRTGQAVEGTNNLATLAAWRKNLMQSSPTKTTRKRSQATTGLPAGTWALFPSDLQLGKPGTQEAVHNFRTGITQGLQECERLIESGVDVEGIHLGWGGDETEGICNSYANQPYVIELNRSEQLELDTDLRIWAIKEAQQRGIKVSVSSVQSNHGDWGRNGGKDSVTTKADNSSTYVAREVRRFFDELADEGVRERIDWTIGTSRDETPGLVVTLSGEKIYVSHGHIEKGKGGSTELRTKGAIENQLLGDLTDERRLIDIRLFVMAHYHHHYLLEDRNRTIMGLPALEASWSSSYMRTQFGVHSPPGLVGALIGKFDYRPYRHLSIFGSKPAA